MTVIDLEPLSPSIIGIGYDLTKRKIEELLSEFNATPTWRRIKRHKLAYRIVILSERLSLLEAAMETKAKA